MKIRVKWLYYTLGLILGLIILVVITLPSPTAKLIVCDVGQGDAILITKGSSQVLIDGGPSGDRLQTCLNRHVPFWDRNIELIVFTNTDYDHLNGLTTVVDRYSLTSIVTSDGVHDSEALDRFVEEVAADNEQVQLVQQGDTIVVGEKDKLTFSVLWPPKADESYMSVFSNQIDNAEREQILGASAKRGNLNERSVVLLWDELGYKILLTGDSGDQTELSLIQGNMLPDVDLLKVGHHGSKYSTGTEFLNRVRPELAVISVGERNSYGHPTLDTLNRLNEVGARVMRTDLDGEIVIPIGK